MDNRIKDLCEFLDQGKSVYHGIDNLKNRLLEAGYTQLPEGAKWDLIAGGKYFMIRGGTSLMAFRIPAGEPSGFMMSAAHSDRPSFKLKENGELTGAYTRLSTEKYGGMLMAPWLDRPLSLAGRVMVETESGADARLVDIDRDLLLIPNVAIHMNRKANDGFAYNPAVDTLPLMGGKAAAGKLEALLEELAGGKILGHDLYLYVRQKAAVWGMDGEYISAAALDDLASVWCCAEGFLNSKNSAAVPMLCVFDSEEVGSASVQGADSDLLESVLGRICAAMDWDMERLLSQSFMVSADNAHAIHPNHPEFADPKNAPVVNGGVVLKFNANQRYTTSGMSAAVMRTVCRKAGVPLQTYCNRADMPGGATLGCISVSHVSVPAVDVGLPQLAMHSCYETAGVQDALYLADAMAVFHGMTLQIADDGTFTAS